MRIPVVDVSAPEAVAAQQLRQACTEAGFFHVSNHGVPEELVKAMFDQVRAAFALPLEVKQAMLVDRHNRGWTPFASQTFDPDSQSKPDTKEGFYFGHDQDAPSPALGGGSPTCAAAAAKTPDPPPQQEQEQEQPQEQQEQQPQSSSAAPLHGANRWPPEDLVPGFRATVAYYYEALTALGARLLRLLGLALGLDPSYLQAHFFATSCSVLRPLHYSAEVSRPSEGVLAAGAHTDFGLLTILATDEVPGLQAFIGGSWQDVAPVPGTFIVNLGDVLEMLTNGLLPSTRHRVVNAAGRERYSIAYFMDPDFDAPVAPLACCVGPGRPAAYPPTTAGQHLLAKLGASLDKKSDKKSDSEKE